MSKISDERLAELRAAIELRRSTTPIKEEWEFFASLQSILTELQSLRSQAGVSEAVETQATLCSEWPLWLHEKVDGAMEISDRKDWSTEQVVAYGILSSSRPATFEITDAMVERFGQAFWGVNWHRGSFETIRSALTAALQGETK